LKQYKIISKAVALLLVMLLMLSITPKFFLHEIFADHNDAASCNDTKLVGPCIHKEGYNCQQSDLVVPNAYLVIESPELIPYHDFRDARILTYSFCLTKSFVCLSHGRAPPHMYNC
jgi:hypothetical protein